MRQGETGRRRRQALVLAAISVVLPCVTGDHPDFWRSRPASPEVVPSGRHYRPVKTACQRHFGDVRDIEPLLFPSPSAL